MNVDYDFGIKNMSGFNLGQLFAIKVDPKNCPKNCLLNWRKKCNFLIDMIHPFWVIIENNIDQLKISIKQKKTHDLRTLYSISCPILDLDEGIGAFGVIY